MHKNTFKKLLKRFLKSYSKIKCFRNLSNPFKQTKVAMNKKTLCSLPITKLRLKEKGLVETFNEHDINIVENSRGVKTYNTALENNILNIMLQ